MRYSTNRTEVMFSMRSFLFVIIVERVLMEGATTGGEEDGMSKVR